MLTNLEILKLIKIAIRPLKSTTKLSLKKLSRMAIADKKVEDLKVCLSDLRQKERALEIMFDCYSLVIEAYLHAADPNYFVIDHRDIEYGVSAKLLSASRSKGINI